MSGQIGKSERETQNRVIALFRDALGYRFLGNFHDRTNSNIEESLLRPWLSRRGYSRAQIDRALDLLGRAASHQGQSLYDRNQAVYQLLRYGVPVKIDAGENTETVGLVDWELPDQNEFAIAEEVTLRGGQERRPDLVLYLNGIAIGVIELKNSRTTVGDGIRQLLSNQQKEWNEWFFSTVQIVFAGNDSEGLRYGTIETEGKYFLTWKEDETDNRGYKLDKYLLKMCEKQRLLELVHDFVLFDAGQKKLPRVHQYFGVKAAQKHVRDRQGGIIWHTQGSGKSIVMVLLAKWILEALPRARVLILTDRDELDKQIERVFANSGSAMQRTQSGRDLIEKLGQVQHRLLCSLIHKFGQKGVNDFDTFIEELKKQPSRAVGELFVFVDECHRTQSGRLHKTMKAMLPGSVFIGFTGTPLLKKDRQTTLEVFGGYIHTYKFNEAVEDGVVLDLVYEARDIEQRLGSQSKIDAWFDSRTHDLNDWQKAALREQWGTMQKVLSSKSRMNRVVADIIFDFSVTTTGKPRLSSGRGNAMLVASSIYEAARYYTLFQDPSTGFRGKCALVTSYNPAQKTHEQTKEETGASTETEKQFLHALYTELLKDVVATPGKSKAETYEDKVRELFRKQPEKMRLLIVVDKLLTGFDSPHCTYLYIDKSMQDHGLFQAICRTNRLDGEDKQFGYIVDYKDLFKKVHGAISVYTSELDHSAGGASPEVLLEDRLKKGRRKLDEALEQMAYLCDPVLPPKGELEYIHYFCGNVELPTDLQEHEPQRVTLYKQTAHLLRTYASIADEMTLAGYSPQRSAQIRQEVERYVKLRDTVKQASGETIDLKMYEADMRHLIDTYIEASEPRPISQFGELGLLDLIVKLGIAEAIDGLPDGIKRDQRAVAETIANNVRSKILKSHLLDPAFYERMSALLGEILADLREKRISYESFLQRVAEVVKQVQSGHGDDSHVKLDTPGKRALFGRLKQSRAARKDDDDEGKLIETILSIDRAVRKSRPSGWRGVIAKEQIIKQALFSVLNDRAEVELLFLILKAQPEY